MFTKAKTVATCHPWTETSYDVRARFYTRLDKYMLRWMHAVTAVSQSVRAEVSGNGRCSVIPNGINVRRFYVSANRDQLRRTIGVGDSDFLFGAVGRLVPEKGYDILIASAREIVKQFPNTKFVIVGDGVLREKLEAEVDACHLRQNVILAGARSDIPELLHAMDAFVLSSKSEGMPMAVLEAMASGKPIVATEVGNVPDLLEKGKSGRLVPPNDADALAVGLRGLLENSTLSDELGLAAKRRVAAHYSSDVMTSGYLRVYEHVLGFASCCSSSPKTS
jgi:glycosyltransferase involved in cell wall biosynthesis